MNLYSIRGEIKEVEITLEVHFLKTHYLLLKDCLCRTQGQERIDPSFLWLVAFLMTVDMKAPSRELVNRSVEAQIGKRGGGGERASSSPGIHQHHEYVRYNSLLIGSETLQMLGVGGVGEHH